MTAAITIIANSMLLTLEMVGIVIGLDTITFIYSDWGSDDALVFATIAIGILALIASMVISAREIAVTLGSMWMMTIIVIMVSMVIGLVAGANINSSI